MKKWERDAIDSRIEVLFEKSKITEAESYNMETLADIAYQLTRIADELQPAARMVVEANKPIFGIKPAPDVAGLVEAVKGFLRDEICGGYEKPTWEKHSVRHLQDALAAHEPEVK